MGAVRGKRQPHRPDKQTFSLFVGMFKGVRVPQGDLRGRFKMKEDGSGIN
jgi:hypothetical protein